MLVINTLVASLFVHEMQVLPRIPEYIIKEIEKEMEKFIWNGRKPKIKLSQLQQCKQNGGLKLVNLRKKDLAIKVKWKQNLESEPKLANIANDLINPVLKEKIWLCNIKTTDINVLNILSKFWEDVIYAWSELNYDPNKEKDFIWYNSCIRIDNKPFFWKNIFKKGLFYVKQLYNNGNLISCKNVMELYGLSIMNYNKLISMIPKSLKKITANYRSPNWR